MAPTNSISLKRRNKDPPFSFKVHGNIVTWFPLGLVRPCLKQLILRICRVITWQNGPPRGNQCYASNINQHDSQHYPKSIEEDTSTWRERSTSKVPWGASVFRFNFEELLHLWTYASIRGASRQRALLCLHKKTSTCSMLIAGSLQCPGNFLVLVIWRILFPRKKFNLQSTEFVSCKKTVTPLSV